MNISVFPAAATDTFKLTSDQAAAIIAATSKAGGAIGSLFKGENSEAVGSGIGIVVGGIVSLWQRANAPRIQALPVYRGIIAESLSKYKQGSVTLVGGGIPQINGTISDPADAKNVVQTVLLSVANKMGTATGDYADVIRTAASIKVNVGAPPDGGPILLYFNQTTPVTPNGTTPSMQQSGAAIVAGLGLLVALAGGK